MKTRPVPPDEYSLRAPRRAIPVHGWLMAVLFLAMGPSCPLDAQGGPQSDPMDQLLGPIALYPDPLVALILPASALPSDIVAAANYLQANGDPSQIGFQAWDNSVKGLAHYPDVLEWMAQNLSWTQAVGAAFANDPGAVLQAVQRLRAEARANGALVSTPQQTVIADDYGKIEIVPAQPEVIYVPRYDPAVVYVSGGYGFGGASYITYGNPYPVGAWLTFGFDWRGGSVWVGDWSTWHNAGGWRRSAFTGGYRGGEGHRWGFPADRQRPQFRSFSQARSQEAAPRPMRGAPSARPYAESAGDRGRPPMPRATQGAGRPAAGPHGPEKAGEKKPQPKKRPASGEKTDERDKGR